MKILKNKKGFTLVEIIVVLVIIAILAAISLPALTGYISDAREKSAISEGRTVMVAAQTISSELTGIGKGEKDMANVEAYIKANSSTGTAAIAGYSKTITSLTGIKAGDVGTLSDLAISDDGALESFTYTLKGGAVVKLASGVLSVVKATA